MAQAILLALIAGCADTVGYLRFKAFAGLMTGNTIFLGVELAEQKWSAAANHFAIIVMFLVGVALAQAFLRLTIPVWTVLCGVGGLLVLCGFLDHELASLVLPLGMGLQNSAANRFNGVALNTVFITGNLQKVGEGLIHWLWHARQPNAPPSDGFAIFGWVWIAYAVGAGFGAIAERHMVYPLLVPAAVLPVVMLPRLTRSRG
ncbi:MAG: YoaK family protein [Hyphomicrobiaceae bacterium]